MTNNATKRRCSPTRSRPAAPASSPRAPSAPASYPAALAAAQARLDESDFAEDWDDPEHLTPVFPPDFVAPCERCGGSSLGDRYCPSCELELEGWES